MSIVLIEDVKLGKGKDCIREVWFEHDGKQGSILLRGEGCHEKDVNDILEGAQKTTNSLIKRRTEQKINGRLGKIKKIK